MQQEALLVGAFQAVDVLLVLAGAERGDDHRLRLAAGKQGRAVRARQEAGFRDDRAYRLHVAAVDADAGVEDVPAHHLGLQVVEDLADGLLGELRLLALGEHRGIDLGLHRVDCLVAVLLDGDLVGLAQLALGDGGDRRLDRGMVGQHEVARLLGGLLGEPDDCVQHRLEAAMAEHHRLEHNGLGQLLGLGLDHQDRVGGAGDDEIEGRLLHFVDRRVELQLAADLADPGGADRAHERDAGEGQRRRRGDHGEDVGIVLEVMRQHGDDHLRIVAVARGEQRADGDGRSGGRPASPSPTAVLRA